MNENLRCYFGYIIRVIDINSRDILLEGKNTKMF